MEEKSIEEKSTKPEMAQRWPVDWEGPTTQTGKGQKAIPVKYHSTFALFSNLHWSLWEK